jgi:hypothetical protein
MFITLKWDRAPKLDPISTLKKEHPTTGTLQNSNIMYSAIMYSKIHTTIIEFHSQTPPNVGVTRSVSLHSRKKTSQIMIRIERALLRLCIGGDSTKCSEVHDRLRDSGRAQVVVTL